MSSPIVVQGTPVSDPYGSRPQQSSAAPNVSSLAQQTQVANPSNITKGEKQESKCRDPIFAILLYANIACIAAVAGVYGVDAFNEGASQSFQEFEGYMYAVLITGAISLGLSAGGMWVMMRIPQFLIKTSLIFSVVMTGVWAIISFAYGAIGMGIFGLVFFAISVCYAYAVWSRIPFATANLVTACTAVRANLGVTLLAYWFVLLAFGWSILWAIALMGVWDKTYTCTDNANGTGQTCTDPNYGYLFLLFVSYFFTHQVIQNTVHVVVAGTVGTWWFSPEESGCCSSGVRDSFCRATTTSFGSICFGSLLVAIIRALEQLANQARAEGDAGILACIAECILSCLASIVEYFNQWAFVYVGLYGYSYLEAGKNVFTLFRNRGWDAIIADDLVGNCLFLVSVVVGGIAGVLGIVVEQTSDFFENTIGDATVVAFVLGFVVGLVLCSILMSTIASGVNTVIVLFAEAPAEFQQNYPDLSQQMREAWLGAFPGSVQ